MVLRWIGGLLVVYVLYAGFFYLVQRSVLYPGTRLGSGTSWPGASGDLTSVEQVEIQTTGGPIDVFYVARDPTSGWDGSGQPPSGAAPAPIVFHGNAELAADLIAPFSELRRLGVAALFVEYPGFGGRAGRPSEQSIMATATAAYDWLADRSDVDASRIFAIGRSLGTGPAVGLSQVRDLRALVLWSPFVSVGHLALRKYGLPPFLAKDRFDSRAGVREFDGPVLVFHGRADRVIPHSNGVVLTAAGRNARLISWECAHNDCPPSWLDLWGPLAGFLDEHDLALDGLGQPPR